MAKTDPALGQRVKARLIELGLETQTNDVDFDAAHASMYEGVSNFMHNMGLDVDNDPSIQDTPNRIAEMFTYELCYGLNYDNFPKCTAQPNGTFIDNPAWEEAIQDAQNGQVDGGCTPMPDQFLAVGKVDEMVVVDSIQTISLCEHHFQTIHGYTHVAYLPGSKLLGLSKFARVVNFFARRPQVQERMTEQVYAALSLILETEDVAIVQRAVHNCMRARGAMDPSSKTTTSKMGGRFLTNPAARNEFLQGIPHA